MTPAGYSDRAFMCFIRSRMHAVSGVAIWGRGPFVASLASPCACGDAATQAPPFSMIAATTAPVPCRNSTGASIAVSHPTELHVSQAQSAIVSSLMGETTSAHEGVSAWSRPAQIRADRTVSERCVGILDRSTPSDRWLKPDPLLPSNLRRYIKQISSATYG